MYHIAIIGVGGLGSRHLQSLASLKEPAEIQAVDISEESISVARERFESMRPGAHLSLSFCRTVADLNHQLDVVIVATNSMPRRSIVEELLAAKSVRMMILEKVLFPKLEDYSAIDELLRKSGCQTWVNHPRRLLPFYQRLREIFAEEKNIHVDIYGGNWGLACNSMHFLDLIGHIAGDGTAPVIYGKGLDQEILPSKRKGYIEFTGTLTGDMGRCQMFSITSAAGEMTPVRMAILGEQVECVIHEERNKAFILRQKDNWNVEACSIDGKLQSESTGPLVETLLRTGICDLPDYQTAMREHIPFIRALLEILSQRKGEEVIVCPVT